MLAKRRETHGEEVWSSKLTDELVLEIRRIYSSGAAKQSDLVERFGVSAGAICGIVNGKSWKHLLTPGAPPIVRVPYQDKLSDDDVRAIRRLHAEGIRQVDMVARFKVSPMTISNVVNRKRRAAVPDLDPQ